MNSRIGKVWLAACVVLIPAMPSARADTILFATSLDNSQLVQVNITTNTTTVLLHASSPDSIVIDSQGRFVYDESATSELHRYDPMTMMDSTLVSTGLNGPQDIALDPGGNSLLISNFSGNNITRTDLNTLMTTTLVASIPGPEGIAYDNAGHLFVLAGFGSTAMLYQIDPVTGAVLRMSAAFDPTNSLDGLTFDPFSGLLYATSKFGNALYSINPSTLAATNIGTIGQPDGLTTNSNGLLYVTSRNDFNIHSFNINTQQFSTLTNVPGLDDLAPASGLGSGISSVPEPSSLLLLGGGVMALALLRGKLARS